MTTASAPAIFVINLDRSPDRMRSIHVQLARLGLPYTRIPAVDGDAPALPIILEQLSAKIAPARKRQLSRREIGCYASHLTVFDALEDSGAASAIILEDDVVLDARFADAGRALAARFQSAPAVVKMESWRKRRLSLVTARVPGFDLVFAPHALTETGAYFVTATAARMLRRELREISEAYDDALYADRQGRIDVLTLSPSVAHQSSQFESMIEHAREAMRRKAFRRPAVLREVYRPIRQCNAMLRTLRVTQQRFGWSAMFALQRRMITSNQHDSIVVGRGITGRQMAAPRMVRSVFRTQPLQHDVQLET